MSMLLDISDLDVVYGEGSSAVHAVQQVSLSIGHGETVALVGESGSGKSTVARAILGLLPPTARTGGRITLAGAEVSPGGLSKGTRSCRIGLVPQYPVVSLNPTMRIGRQVAEALIKAKGGRYRGLDADVIDLLDQVGLDRAAVRAQQYPHQLSGGMCQRVLIAIALAGDPVLILADEPTSALDVTVQKKILDHLERLVSEHGISLLMITHDLGVAADRADRLFVMKDGRLIEHGRTETVLRAPRQDYTRTLISAARQITVGAVRHKTVDPAPELFRMEGIGKVYPLSSSGRGGHAALSDVTLRVAQGQTLAIVGESGSGKTTTLKIALGLETPDAGRLFFRGKEITHLNWCAMRPVRRHMQLVQQHPAASLDPHLSVRQSLAEPLACFSVARGEALRAEVRRLMDLVRLPQALLERRPSELSGGQCQRVTIARALALKPELLFLDEPVSALDVTAQARILELLATLQEELGISYVVVTHDLSVVADIAHHVAVFRNGRVVEQGEVGCIFTSPATSYTHTLLNAVPGRRLDEARHGTSDGVSDTFEHTERGLRARAVSASASGCSG